MLQNTRRLWPGGPEAPGPALGTRLGAGPGHRSPLELYIHLAFKCICVHIDKFDIFVEVCIILGLNLYSCNKLAFMCDV